MRLMGAGLPRTATTTQKMALEMLDVGPCYHMRDLLMNMDHVPLWDIYFGHSVMHHLSRARYQVDPEWRAWIDLMTRMTWTGKGAFAGAYAERQQLMDAAVEWNEEVKP